MTSLPRPADPSDPRRGERPGRWHVHRFRWSPEPVPGNGSVYACRCGAVRPGI